MTRAVFLTFVALLCLPAAPAQAKSRKPLVGFGEQSQWIFSDERWFTLENNHRHYVRYVMPWDALRYKSTRAPVDAWMNAARRRHARVLLAFGHSMRRHRQLKRSRPGTRRITASSRRAAGRGRPGASTTSSSGPVAAASSRRRP